MKNFRVASRRIIDWRGKKIPIGSKGTCCVGTGFYFGLYVINFDCHRGKDSKYFIAKESFSFWIRKLNNNNR
jgi:hypothetical protein